MNEIHNRPTDAAVVRPVLQAIGRLIATDRRAVVLATSKAEVLLSNNSATQLGLDTETLLAILPWHEHCTNARRAGSVAVSAVFNAADLEGELVHFPLGNADGFLLRFAETDQEVVLLRNRARTATLLRVSHDLRTPIQSLLATADAVLLDPASNHSSAPANRDRLNSTAQRALNHIDNVIKVIRGELSISDLQADEDFDLVEEVQSTLDMIEPIATARGTRLQFQASPGKDMRLRGPVRFVRALLQNMFDNSVKYGGSKIQVHLTGTEAEASAGRQTTERAMKVTIEVLDLGGGMPEAQKTRLRGAVAARAEEGASGGKEPGGRPSVGLNVIAHAIGQLGGTIDVEDRRHPAPGGGAAAGDAVVGTTLRATFTLPVAAPASYAAPSTKDDDAPADKSLTGLGVLVVEDSPSSRDWLVHVLGGAGARVVTADNGLKALALLQKPEADTGIDLMVSDLSLPHMSGLELARKIRALQTAGEMTWQGRIVGLSAHVDDKLRDACVAAGMLRVLEKPIRYGQLRAAIRGVFDTGPESSAAEAPSGTETRGASAAASGSAENPFDRKVVKEMVEQLGIDGSKGFMRRAHAEARGAYGDMSKHGVHVDTVRILHAATGACGMTGLAQLEKAMRTLETALRTPDTGYTSLLADLERALDLTAQAIEKL